MPVYEFECDRGHRTEIVRSMRDDIPKTVDCETCPHLAHRVFSSPPTVVPDFPQHFNISLGQVVNGRAHLRQLQKQLGVQDYEPCRNSPGSQLVQDRLNKRGRVIYS